MKRRFQTQDPAQGRRLPLPPRHRGLLHPLHLRGSRPYAPYPGRLNRLDKDYNFVRLHKALGNRTPTSVYTASSRLFPAGISLWDYPRDFNVTVGDNLPELVGENLPVSCQ